MSTMLQMQRANLDRARAQLISGTKKKAANWHMDVANVCDLIISGKVPSDEEEASDFEKNKARLLEFYPEKFKSFVRQVDLLRQIELKGW